MKRNGALWLGYIALVMAVLALVLRIARGRVEDWTDVLGPIAIILFLLSIILRERKQHGNEGSRG